MVCGWPATDMLSGQQAAETHITKEHETIEN